MRLLDLFCGAGGASMGYYQAGFDDIVGVDIRRQPRYPFHFIQGDALEYLAEHGHEFDAIHASPPCQAFSQAVKIRNRVNRPNLIPATRDALIRSGSPYIIENVPTAIDHLVEPVMLCGSSFGLPVRRHRLFESNFWIWGVRCSHKEYPRKYPPAWNRTKLLRVLSLSGGFSQSEPGQISGATIDEHRDAMGIDWDMDIKELSQSIPPAYTRFIGLQLLNKGIDATHQRKGIPCDSDRHGADLRLDGGIHP